MTVTQVVSSSATDRHPVGVGTAGWETIPARLFTRARTTPDAAAYYERVRGVWHGTSWAGYAQQVERAGRALLALGLEPRQTVSILGFNRPEWVIMDIATMAAGGAPVGVYTTCSPEEVRYIVAHAESPIVLVENEEQWRKIAAERDHMPKLRHVVIMRNAPRIDDDLVMSWEEFLSKGDEVDAPALHARIQALEPDQLATLIYTSGTTGPPKGVMLSHRNLAWTSDVARQISGVTPGDSSLSYLPLSHIAEQMFSIHVPITTGVVIYYAESIARVPENLREVRPSVFFGVPRIWEKFYAGIGDKLGQARGTRRKLATWAMDVGRRIAAERAAGREPVGLLAAQYELARRLVFQKVKSAVGLSRARFLVSGAAPVAREVLELLASLDMIVLEVYGQSEGCGPTTFNLPDRFRFGAVGPALPGVDVRIADDGEILVRGPNVFLGYYKDEEATRETLRDGWLHSGDLGAFDEDGFLHITGRKKDIIITAGGKNVTPANIEGALKLHELINEAVIVGDKRKYLTALLTLDPEVSTRWAKEHGVEPDRLRDDPKLLSEIQKAVDDINRKLARVEQVKRFRVLERNLTVEDGELTPSLKVKRNVVHDHFAHEIEAMYAE